MGCAFSGHYSWSLLSSKVEYYFSDLNWSKDEYLRSLADSDGFVAIPNIMDFKLLKQICSDFETIRDSLQTSEDLQLSACGNRLRKAGASLRWPFQIVECAD